LVVALFPSYSSTETPTNDPVIPPAPPITSSETVVSLGLPFSPLVAYHDAYTWQSDGGTSTKAGRNGQPLFVKATTMRMNYTQRWSMEWISWSAALVVVAVGLLAVAGRRKPGRVPPPPVTPTPPASG
jgi:hypothetical protein